MKWDARSGLLLGALAVMVVLGGVWVAQSLRREEPRMIVNPEAPSIRQSLHPQLEAGIAALREGRLEAAREALEAVPVTHPSYSVAVSTLGDLHRQQGDLDAAVEAYKMLMRLQPGTPEPYLLLGRVEHERGNDDRAEWYAMRAIEVAPAHLAARYDVALFRVSEGRIADAVESYGRALSLDPGRAHTAEAERQLRRIVEERPTDADPHYALAYFANQRGDTAEEIRELELYLELGPEGEAAATARERLADARAAAASGDGEGEGAPRTGGS
jgi:tetratricopeptide (TPR) repeat protein